eukprot:7452701-Pyramimonas_sp.AAC.1
MLNSTTAADPIMKKGAQGGAIELGQRDDLNTVWANCTKVEKLVEDLQTKVTKLRNMYDFVNGQS